MKILKRILSMILVLAFVMGSSGFDVSAAKPTKPPKSITILTVLETLDVYSGEENAVDFTIEAKYGDVDASGDAWSYSAIPDESLYLEDYGEISLADNNPLTERKLIWNFSYVAPVVESDTIIPFDLELSDGVTSDTIRVYFNVFGSGTIYAQIPEITAQPTDTTVTVGEAATLSVTASVDSGELSYQWFSNSTDSNVGGSAIDGASSATYTFTPTAAGTYYYYCEIENYDETATGEQRVTTISDPATVEVTQTTDAQAPTIATQPIDTTVTVGVETSLTVVASVDSGLLSYQWYSNSTDSNAGGVAITGATSATYTFTPTAAGTYYYYCEIENYDATANGEQRVTTISDPATVEVTQTTDAQTPTIATQPIDTTVTVGVETSLTVVASVDSGLLSYQWYSNSTDSNAGGVAIDGATSATYTFTPTAAGTYYYYCEIENYDATANGEQRVTTISDPATVTATQATDAQTPTIATQPIDTTVTLGVETSLTVVASVDSGVLSYQWYSNSTDSNAGGSAIDGATSATYTFTPTAAGTYYYYCEIENYDETATGEQIVTATSDPATVEVTDVQTPPEPNTLNYVILGDSIATGTVTGNEMTDDWGVPSEIDSYADYFANYLMGLGYDTVNVSDYSTDGDQSYQLLEKLSSPDYQYIQDAIAQADVITISIGGNNLMRAAMDDSLTGYNFDNVDLVDADLGRQEFAIEWPEIVDLLDVLTDGEDNESVDADIIVNTVYNPYWTGDDLYNDVDELLNGTQGINTVIKDNADMYDIADVYSIFSAFSVSIDGMNEVTYMYTDKTMRVFFFIVVELRNPHPTAYGQSLIYNEVVNQYEN